MVRKPCQFHLCCSAIFPGGQNDVEDLGSRDGIGTEGLIKITDTEQQQGVRVLGFDAVVLRHEGRFLGPFFSFCFPFGPSHGLRRRLSVCPDRWLQNDLGHIRR